MFKSKINKTVYEVVWRLLIIIFIFSVPFILIGFTFYYWGIIILILWYFLNILAFYHSSTNKRSDIQSKWSWTIIFLLIPGGGFAAYLFGGYVPNKIARKYQQTSLLKNEPNLIELNSKDIELIFQGRNKFKRLLKDLQLAKEFINIQYFIINDGIIYHQIEEILIQKIKEGVEVRMITDYMGSIQTPDKVYQNLINAGVKFYQFNKVNCQTLTGIVNWRSHNKFVIIDNKIAYFGGLNIGDEYVGLYPKYGAWYDMHVVLRGEIVEQMNHEFNKQWFIVSGEKLDNRNFNSPISIADKISIQLINDGPQYEAPIMLNKIIQLINDSKTRVLISSPYLILPNILLKTIENATARGVEVLIITIGRADKKSAFSASKYYADKLVSCGAKVYRMNNIFNHSKFYLFDDEISIIGTTNLDYRALFLHFETNLLVKDKTINNELFLVFNEWKKISFEIQTSSIDWTKWSYLKFLFWKFVSPTL